MTQSADLADIIGRFYYDPLGFVLFAFPWGEGSLRDRKPSKWQVEFLQDVGRHVKERDFNGIDAVAPIRFSTASGHGIGKSALVAWLILWIMSTRPHCKGVVTANTADQLRTKTWSELAKWHHICATKDWFHLNAGGGSLNMYQVENGPTWRVDAQTCREENSEAFAGLHAANSTPFFIFDEASAVPDKIFEVREGGTTDGEPMLFDFGNPTRNSGTFYQNMIGKFRHLYERRHIDSRDVEITNKAVFDQWAKDWGEDSDFFRVRVRGLFPEAGSLQFIPSNLFFDNIDREVIVSPAEPLVFGVDVARYGDDRSVLWKRRGRDHVSYPHVVFPTQDIMQLSAHVADHINRENPDLVFVDGGGVGGGVVDRLRQMGYQVIDVNGGGKATLPGYADMRAQMWGLMRDALREGAHLPNDDDLYTDLIGVEYGFTMKNAIRLEKKEDMKKRGMASPDMADAMALTYAMPHSHVQRHDPRFRPEEDSGWDYDPLEAV